MDDADRAQGVEELTRDLALAQRAARQDEAPLVIGDVRICRWCNEEIEPQRLEANPQAVRCVECQSRHERHGGN